MQTTSPRRILTNALPLILGLVSVVLIFYLADLFRKTSFAHNGEAYWKGYGHLLREDFTNGVLFLTAQHFLGTASISYVLFLVVPKTEARGTFGIFLTVAIIVVLLSFLCASLTFVDAIEDHKGSIRLIEIVLTQLLRVAGLVFGYKLAMRIRNQHKVAQI